MRKKFLSDFFFIQLINLLIKPVWILVIDRKVQNQLPVESYGTYFSLTGYSLLFMILLDLGITQYNNREVSLDRNFYHTRFWTIFNTKLLLAFLFFIAAMGTGAAIGFTHTDLTVFSLLALNQCLLSFNTFLRSNISAIHQFKTDGLLSVADKLLVVLFLGTVLYTSLIPVKLDIYLFILVQTFGLALTFILSWLANYKLLGPVRFQFSFYEVIPLIKKSMPFAIIIALMTFYTRLDSVLILKLLPDGRNQAGYYAMSYRLLDAAAIVGSLMAGQLLPLFASNLINKARLFAVVKWASVIALIPALAGTLACSYYGSDLMRWLYPEKFTVASGWVFTLLIWCIPGMVLVNIFGTLLTAAGNIKTLNRIALLTCLINLLGNLILMPGWGLIAAAGVAVITQVFFGLMCYYYARPVYTIKP